MPAELRRLKKVARAVWKAVPQTEPRVDVYPGAQEPLPPMGLVAAPWTPVRVVAAPRGPEWRALMVYANPHTGDVYEYVEAPSSTFDDHDAAAWFVNTMADSLHRLIVTARRPADATQPDDYLEMLRALMSSYRLASARLR